MSFSHAVFSNNEEMDRINTSERLAKLKQEITALIRRNSDRGFLPYSGCNKVCAELLVISDEANHQPDRRYAFDVHLLVLLSTVKLISHADTSSGLATDVVNNCLHVIDGLCLSAAEEDRKPFFDSILKAVNNKAFNGWAGTAYGLLCSSVHFVNDSKQAAKVYAMFPILGPTYSGKEYPDVYRITFSIIQRLEGKAAADQYAMDHLEVDELREIAVENALTAKRYELAERLCLDALTNRYWSTAIPKWALYLERVYTETSNVDKLTEWVRHILFKGHTSYYSKLKELYKSQDVWNEEKKESLLDELAAMLLVNTYANLLDKEGEYFKLLGVVEHNPYLIDYFGKRLAMIYPEDSRSIYEQYIMREAVKATDRRNYKGICRLIKNYEDACGKRGALLLIDRLSDLYPRRPAMLDELVKLKHKLEQAKG